MRRSPHHSLALRNRRDLSRLHRTQSHCQSPLRQRLYVCKPNVSTLGKQSKSEVGSPKWKSFDLAKLSAKRTLPVLESAIQASSTAAEFARDITPTMGGLTLTHTRTFSCLLCGDMIDAAKDVRREAMCRAFPGVRGISETVSQSSLSSSEDGVARMMQSGP